VAGVFGIEGGGKIKAWRDYFDTAAWTRQNPGG
jgi:limonene-1,2-epoxide hydrolase